MTHAVPVAAGLAGNPQIEPHLLPGRVRTTTQAAVGVDTSPPPYLRADVAFLGTNAPTPEHGLTTPDRDEPPPSGHGRERPAGRRPRGREQDRRRVLPRFATLDEVDVSVTDDGVADADRRA